MQVCVCVYACVHTASNEVSQIVEIFIYFFLVAVLILW